MRSFLLRLFYHQNIICSEFNQSRAKETQKYPSNCIMGKIKNGGYHGRVVGFYHLNNKALKLFEAKVFELLT